MTNILTPGNSWYRSLLWDDICAKPVQVANGNHVQSIGKQGMSWLGQGRRGCFCSSRHSAPSLGSVLHLRTKAANTKRSGLGTRPEFYTIWWSSPEWHVSPLLQKAKKGVERGWKQKINQQSQAYWVSKNGMGPAIVWCHHDLYTGSCGHCGPFKDVWESTLKNQYTQSSERLRFGQAGPARESPPPSPDLAGGVQANYSPFQSSSFREHALLFSGSFLLSVSQSRNLSVLTHLYSWSSVTLALYTPHTSLFSQDAHSTDSLNWRIYTWT